MVTTPWWMNFWFWLDCNNRRCHWNIIQCWMFSGAYQCDGSNAPLSWNWLCLDIAYSRLIFREGQSRSNFLAIATKTAPLTLILDSRISLWLGFYHWVAVLWEVLWPERCPPDEARCYSLQRSNYHCCTDFRIKWSNCLQPDIAYGTEKKTAILWLYINLHASEKSPFWL